MIGPHFYHLGASTAHSICKAHNSVLSESASEPNVVPEFLVCCETLADLGIPVGRGSFQALPRNFRVASCSCSRAGWNVGRSVADRVRSGCVVFLNRCECVRCRIHLRERISW